MMFSQEVLQCRYADLEPDSKDIADEMWEVTYLRMKPKGVEERPR